MYRKILYLLKSLLPLVISKFRKLNYRVIIFSSSNNTDYDYNSKYLFEYILKNHRDYKCKYVINDNQKREKLRNKIGDFFIETKSFKGILEVLNAGCWVTSAGLPVYFLGADRRRVVLNLWHGAPLKKIALLQKNISNFTKMYFNQIFSKKYTVIITTSRIFIPIMAKSFGVEEKKIKVLGQPRNDLLWINNDRKNILKSMYKHLPYYKKVILYAPTFRNGKEVTLFPFKDFSINQLNDFLEEQKIIIFIRSHKSGYIYNTLSKSKRIKLMNNDKIEDIMEILNIFDLLITDYSGMYIDYLLIQRPIIFLPYDLEEYIFKRGLNFNYNEFAPGPKPKTQDELLKEVYKLLLDKNYYKKEREEVNKKFNEVKKSNCERNFKYIDSELKKKRII